MVAIFRGLGFEVEGEKQLTVTVPTFRNDISREEDLVEEVARLYGYDRIPSAVPKGTGMMARQSEELRVAAKARDVLTRCGLTEVVTFSLTRPEAEAETAGNKELVRLSNPLVEEFSGLRGSLLPSLLGVAARNFERGTRETSVFEVGKTYEQKADGSCSERWLAGVLISGEGGGQSEDGAEFYRAKAIVEAAAKEFGASPVVVESANRDFYAGGRSGALVREGQVVAEWGQVKQSVAQGFDLPAAFYAEIDLERLGQVWGEDGTRIEYAPIPRYPAARRDLAAEIPEEMTFGELEALVRRNSDELLVEVNVFDVYRGRQIPEGKKSLAVRLGFQASDRTLTDEEVTGRLESIISGLESRGGIRVRKAAG
jgi:phenylalanyl-tRNA synthetase beta chain